MGKVTSNEMAAMAELCQRCCYTTKQSRSGIAGIVQRIAVNNAAKITSADIIHISVKPVGQSSKTGSVLDKASVFFVHVH